MNSNRRHYKLAGLYKKVLNSKVCAYCKERAETWDHFIPISAVSALADIVTHWHNKVLLPCCKECNSLAGNRIFLTIAAKRAYVRTRIVRRYRKYLEMPNWSEEELSTYGSTMADHIRQSLEIRRRVVRRIGPALASGWVTRAVSDEPRHDPGSDSERTETPSPPRRDPI